MVRPRGLYRALGPALEARQMAYRELFREHIDDVLLHEARDAPVQELEGASRTKLRRC